jgi:hypothetical protein
MGGRGSSRKSTGGTLISVPESKKRKRGRGSRRKKIKTEPGNPIGTPTVQKKDEPQNNQ